MIPPRQWPIRHALRASIVVLAATTSAFSSAGQRAPAALSACTTSTAACTEWVTLRGGPGRSMIYRSYSLDTRNDRIRRALIMVHGASRNADHYFATAMAAAFLAGAVDDTIVIAPRIIACTDKPESNEVLLELQWRQLAIGRRGGKQSGALVIRSRG